MSEIFITGGTGYVGSRLIPRLVAAEHTVRALVRAGSEKKLPPGCVPIAGNALEAASYQKSVPAGSTFIQLVGVAHPSPAKAAQFRSIDLVAGKEAVKAAVASGVDHFIYVSAAQPAPVMKAYQQVRAKVEALIQDSRLNATILRPWYVLGPGHLWPYALIPAYWLMERLPSTREGARRLGLVTLEQMLRALANAVESPCTGVRVLGVPEIRGLVLPQPS